MKNALLALSFLLSLPALAASPTKTRTLTATKEFDVPKQVTAFVTNLIDKDKDVAAKFEKLSAKVREEAGGRFSVGEPVAILWRVPSFTGEFEEKGGKRDGEYVYLVNQSLVAGYHRGYAIDDSVVAKVRVKLHEDYAPKPRSQGDYVLTKTQLTLTFEGFVALEEKPR